MDSETNIIENNAQDDARLRASALLIVLFTVILAFYVGILLLIMMVPKNGLKTEINENGEEVSYMYYNDEKLTGWQPTKWYMCYYDPTDGHMVKGRYTIDGVEYYFDPETGRLTLNSTITHDDGTKVTYDRYGRPKAPTTPGLFTEDDGTIALNGTNGKLTGWQTVDGVKYYFQKRTGRMLKNEDAYIDGRYYRFDENGLSTEIGGE